MLIKPRLSIILAALAAASVLCVLVSSPQSSYAANGRSSSTERVTLDPQWPADTTGKGCASPTWKTGTSAKDPRRVLVVGDSLTRESRASLERSLSKRGWLPTVRCWGGKGSAWGVEQVERAREMRQLPETVVVALGTNDVWWLGVSMSDAVDAVMTALGPHKIVYWVNLRFGPNNYSDLPHHGPANRTLREKAREYPNLTIINFSKRYGAALRNSPNIGWADGVHLNTPGYLARTRFIAEALGKPPVHRAS